MHSRLERDLRTALLALLALVFVAAPADASVVIPPADDDLIVHADAVILGRVTDIESHDNRLGKLSTFITLAVEEVLKGSFIPSTLTIRELGGLVGGMAGWVFANPEFTVGERVLLFLDQRPDGTPRVMHLYLGKFSIVTDPASGDLVAVRPLPEDVTVVPPAGAAAAGVALGAVGRELEEFKARIREKAGEARPLTARPSVALPLSSASMPAGISERHQEFRFLRDPNPPAATDPNLVQPRFSQPDTNTPIKMRINVNGEPAAPAGSDGGREQVRAAFRAWSRVPTTAFRYEEGPATTLHGFNFDSTNVVSFRDPDGDISPPSGCSGVLAVGGMFFSPTPTMTVGGRQFSQAVEADLVFADGWEGCGFYYQNFSNLTEVATHELGHALGLGHSDASAFDPATGINGATMFPSAHFDGRNAGLHTDDRNGVSFIYPGRTLTIVKSGGGSGTITSDPAGINCGADCVAGFAPNSNVTLTATPDPGSGSTFTGFTGTGCNTTVSMSVDRTCTATFTTDPDLVISAISGPAVAAPGQTIVLNNTVRNNGLPAGAFNVGLYLANGAVVTTGDRQLTTRRVTGGLGTNATSPDATSVQIPSDVVPGNYFLGAIADIDNEVPAEGSEANNAASTPILIAQADLAVAVLTAPATAGAGLTITVNSTVKNQATAAVSAAASTLAFYLSPDNTFDPVRLAETRAIGTLAKDAVSTGPTTLTIPATTAPGSYVLIAVADDLGVVGESNEANNTRTAPMAISRPNLSVTSVAVTPTLAAAGMNVSVTQVVKNVALAPASAPASTSRLYLSTDATLDDPGDTVLGDVAVGPLAGGAMATVVKSVPIPAGTAPGPYWIIARANATGSIPEADASAPANNVKATAVIVGPDLVVTAAAPTPATTAPGLTVSVSNTVKNQGGQAAGAFDVGVYLSTDNTYQAGVDLFLGSRRVSGLAPTLLSAGAIPVVIPANQPAGNYFLIVRADSTGSAPGEVTEANETNNSFAIALKVARADLSVTSVTAPAVAAAGANVSVTHVVKNLAVAAGGAPATISRLFLSTDATLDGVVVQLGADVSVGALAGGGMATVVKSVLIPPATPPGRYFVIAQANATGTVVEADPPPLANNVRATATSIIIGPDLVVTAATPAPTATAPGKTVNVTNTVKNQGGAVAGSFTVGIYLSDDNVFDAGDTLLNSRPVLSLAAGMMSGPVVTPVVIPAGQSAGPYFLIVRVDNAGVPGSVVEADETNNGRAVPLNVVQPDLTVPSVTATPAAIAPGANVSVTHVVKNVALAAGSASSSTSRLYLSTNATLEDPGDVVLGDVEVGPLTGGAMATLTKSVQVPGDTLPGLYWIIARANATSSVLEADPPGQANNVKTVATPIIVGPDVLVTAARTVASATPGMNVSVTYTLKNRGGQAAHNFDVGFSLVPQPQPGGAEIPLGPSRTGVSLIAGAMAPFTNTVTIPPGTALGAYKVKVTANASGTVVEADENNNALLTGILSVLRPDLNVPTVTFTPAMIAPGGNISVSHVVKNLSAAPGNAGLSASRLLLSTDQTAAGQVADLGTVNVPAIVAGGMTTVMRSAQVPVAVPPGRYFVLAQADTADVILEQNAANNLGASVTRLVVGPDMTVTTASTVAGAIPGANVSVSYTLKNTGSATPAFNVGFVLVPVSPGPDIPIGPTRTAVVLAANGMLATSSTVGVPPGVAAGQYRIRVTADPADTVVEAVETNNSVTTGIVTITPPELSIQSLSVPGTGIAGRSVGIPNTVVNTAAAPGTAPAFQVGLYLASSGVIDPATDTLLTSRTVAALAPAATSAATTTVTLPTTPGNYFIGAVADRAGVVVEANESNNQQSGAIAVVPNMVRPSTPASAQVTLSGCAIAANNGSAILPGTFVVPSQTGAAWGGTVRLVSGPQINTMTIAGSVTVTGDLSGTFSIVNSGGARGNGNFITGTVATPGSPGAVAATFTGSFTVGEICSISGSFTSP